MSHPKTIFQKIQFGEIPSDIQFEDDLCFVLNDINPQAPTHLLIIPKKVIPRVHEAAPEDAQLLGHLLLTGQKMAKDLNLGKGYRLVINNGKDAGETVPHLHVHLLSGRPLMWPPG